MNLLGDIKIDISKIHSVNDILFPGDDLDNSPDYFDIPLIKINGKYPALCFKAKNPIFTLLIFHGNKGTIHKLW